MISNAMNFSPALEMTLLIIILRILSDDVFVPTSPGYHTIVPKIVMRVLFGSLFLGRS